jgi:hypothetical protein
MDSTNLNYNLNSISGRLDLDPFLWNGRYLGKFTSEIILKHINKHMLLKIGDYEHWCQYYTKFMHLTCIIDEIKPFFGIQKRGTNTITINNKNYTIMRAFVDIKHSSRRSEHLECPAPVYNITNIFDTKTGKNPLKHYPSLNEKVKHILIFRDICCCTKNFLSEIILILPSLTDNNEDDDYNCLSLPELYIAKDKDATTISLTVRNRMFDQESIYYTYNLHNIINLKPQINHIIMSISPEHLWFLDLFYYRLLKYLN